MSNSKLDQLILQLENHLECWKQLNHYLNLARTKEFGPEDENQFLELKSVITQELELILATIETGAPSKEEVHSLLASAPSLRFLGELNESALRGIENQWHKNFIAWQSILGQLKVQQQQSQPKSFWSSIFGRGKS
jgi:CHAD domain-containing protein